MTLAYVFPGQGSQSVGMLADVAGQWPQIGATFAEAADVLGTDLWALSQQGPDEALADTRVTQPLVFTADIAVLRVLQAAGAPAPDVVAGHSLGEFAALVASGAMSFADALALVQTRATLMAAAVPDGEGGMAALLGMDDAAVIELCQEFTGERIVEAVNFNAPGQVAISGHVDALQSVVSVARERGAKKAVMLPVSVPNHSSLMRAAGESLATAIDAIDWQMPSVPLLQNASASAPADLTALLASLREHVYNPVQWTRTVMAMREAHGVDTLVEVGPGKVLSGLGKRIDRSLTLLSTESPAAIENVRALSASENNQI